jgi:hypothetical protein
LFRSVCPRAIDNLPDRRGIRLRTASRRRTHDAPCEKSPDTRLISLVEPSGIEPLTS